MKTNRFLFLSVVFVSSIFADTIYLRDGQEVKDAVVTEIGDGDVKYKIGQREVVYTAKKSNIMMIVYNDGTKDIFKAESREAEKPITAGKITENKKDGFAGIMVAGNVSNFAAGNPGPGFTIDGIWNYSITNTTAIRMETILIYRTIGRNWEIIAPPAPNNLGEYANWIRDKGLLDMEAEREYTTAKEFAIGTNVLFHWLPFGGPVFYLEGGFQLGTSLYINATYPTLPSGFAIKEYTRPMLDLGPAFGFGWNINENFALGLRSIVYLTNTYIEWGDKLIQAELGLSYMF